MEEVVAFSVVGNLHGNVTAFVNAAAAALQHYPVQARHVVVGAGVCMYVGGIF